jgi:hypothetical protein
MHKKAENSEDDRTIAQSIKTERTGELRRNQASQNRPALNLTESTPEKSSKQAFTNVQINRRLCRRKKIEEIRKAVSSGSTMARSKQGKHLPATRRNTLPIE